MSRALAWLTLRLGSSDSCLQFAFEEISNPARNCAETIAFRRADLQKNRVFPERTLNERLPAGQRPKGAYFRGGRLDEAAGAADAARGFKWGNRLTVAVFLWVTRRSL